MPSLTFSLFQRPRTLGDCLKLAETAEGVCVCARPFASECLSEFDSAARLVCRFDWQFPSRRCSHETVCGVFRVDDPKPRKQVVIAAANARLERDLARIRQAGVRVDCRPERFTDETS